MDQLIYDLIQIQLSPPIYHLKKWLSHSMKESDAKIQQNKIIVQEIWIARKFST